MIKSVILCIFFFSCGGLKFGAALPPKVLEDPSLDGVVQAQGEWVSLEEDHPVKGVVFYVKSQGQFWLRLESFQAPRLPALRIQVLQNGRVFFEAPLKASSGALNYLIPSTVSNRPEKIDLVRAGTRNELGYVILDFVDPRLEVQE